jgi:hypothetical protein
MDIKTVMNSESARTAKEMGMINLLILFLQSLIPITNQTHDCDSGTGFTGHPK